MYNVVLRILAYNSATPMHVHAAALFSDILSVAAILLFSSSHSSKVDIVQPQSAASFFSFVDTCNRVRIISLCFQ